MPTAAFAGFSPQGPLRPYQISRRAPGPTDVAIEILFCGVCHSDLHTVRGEWGAVTYPCVPGHEIVGRVSSVGAKVSGFAAGNLVGVGCMVDACRTCAPCREGVEQFCERGATWTYDSRDPQLGGVTYGGYSTAIVVDEAFVLRMPAALDPAAAAPLLCAGITTYSPLRHWKIGAGTRVGVVGLGGLGHMAVKLAHAMGAEVVLYTTSPGKKADAWALGAADVVMSRDRADMARHAKRLDFILNTVAVPHDLDAYLAQLRHDGVMTLVGIPATPHPASSLRHLILGRRSLAGSLIGGIRETQEMLDFCGSHGIIADIEVIPIQQINVAYERMLINDVKYRFVIDLASLAGA
jgi:uncharacterized zinc-type alcohol dehydrogenase-like protein